MPRTERSDLIIADFLKSQKGTGASVTYTLSENTMEQKTIYVSVMIIGLCLPYCKGNVIFML